jgi:hypothetical protein
MRTNQVLVASCLAASLLAVGVGCSSTADDGASAPTTVASKSSGGGGVTTTAGSGSSDEEVALPPEWPDELALPDGTVAIVANELTDGHAAVVVARVDGDPKETLDAFEAQLADAGWEIVNSDFTDSPQGGFGGVSATGRQYTVAINLGPAPTGDTTEVTINLAEKTSA